MTHEEILTFTCGVVVGYVMVKYWRMWTKG